jgi:hypothetical protein
MEVLALKRQVETVWPHVRPGRMCPHAGLLCESEPLSCSPKTSEWDPKKFGNIGEVEGVTQQARRQVFGSPPISYTIHYNQLTHIELNQDGHYR